jgi:hypothetical protein
MTLGVRRDPSLRWGPLRGDKIVRLVYLDEAGISNPKDEPFLVIAGIAVNADRPAGISTAASDPEATRVFLRPRP